MNQELLTHFLRELGSDSIRVNYDENSNIIKLIVTLFVPFISICVGVYGIIHSMNYMDQNASVLNRVFVGGILCLLYGSVWLYIRLLVFIKSKDRMINRNGLHSIINDRAQLICDWSEILNVQISDAIVMCKTKGDWIIVATKYSGDFWPINQMFCLLSGQFNGSSNKGNSCGGLESDRVRVSKMVEYFMERDSRNLC